MNMNIHTWEDQVQQDSASSVPDVADGREVSIQDQETDAAQETGHTDGDAVVTGVSVVVEDTEQTLAANVDVAFIDDAAEHHDGENLQTHTHTNIHTHTHGVDYLTGKGEWTHIGLWIPIIPHSSLT